MILFLTICVCIIIKFHYNSDMSGNFKNKKEVEYDINDEKVSVSPEETIYTEVADFISDYHMDILEQLEQRNIETVSFKLKKTSDNQYYDNYKDVMEDVAKRLGAKKEDDSYLSMHARNAIGGNYAYFSWRFVVNEKEYLVSVEEYDKDEFWLVGITKYKTE